jgi:hypothetical protein
MHHTHSLDGTPLVFISRRTPPASLWRCAPPPRSSCHAPAPRVGWSSLVSLPCLQPPLHTPAAVSHPRQCRTHFDLELYSPLHVTAEGHLAAYTMPRIVRMKLMSDACRRDNTLICMLRKGTFIFALWDRGYVVGLKICLWCANYTRDSNTQSGGDSLISWTYMKTTMLHIPGAREINGSK